MNKKYSDTMLGVWETETGERKRLGVIGVLVNGTRYVSLMLFIILGLAGCAKEETITLDPPAENPAPDNPTDEKIQEMLEAYETEIIYQWDRRYIEPNQKVTPPKFELVLPYINMLEEYWIKPFDDQRNNFMRNHIPIEIILFGSNISFYEAELQGFSVLGVAPDVSRILLTGVNGYSMQDSAWFYGQIGTIYHEFAHTIDHKYGRPNGFDDISKGKYAANVSFTQFTMETARERGFWRPYGMSNEQEDFATFVEAFLENTKVDLLIQVKENELLKRKYDLVYNYYLNQGIDLHELKNYIDAKYNQNKTQ